MQNISVCEQNTKLRFGISSNNNINEPHDASITSVPTASSSLTTATDDIMTQLARLHVQLAAVTGERDASRAAADRCAVPLLW